jgi:hypothetical protein
MVNFLLVDRVHKEPNICLNLSRHQLRTAVAFLTGRTPVKKHLNGGDLFGGKPDCRFSKMETETMYHIICCCEPLARQCYNFFGKFCVEPEDISTASLEDVSLFVRDTGLMSLCRKNNTGLHNKPKAAVRPVLLLTGVLGV